MTSYSNNNNNNNTSNTACWIYHERQLGQLCGQHALNNFVQGPIFTIVQLADLAQQLDRMESTIFQEDVTTAATTGSTSRHRLNTTSKSHHVDEAGNFSIEVLKAALLQTCGVNLVHYQSESVQSYLQTGTDITTIQGFICHKNDHWFCIRQLYDRYWNLNSTLDKPTVISHFTLATEMEQYATQHGYTIFCILPPQTLPSSSSSSDRLISQENGATWHLMSDLLSHRPSTTTTTAAVQVDPWEKLNGTGRRLDGQQISSSSSSSLVSIPPHHSTDRSSSTSSYAATTTIDGLTDDEMLQLALQQSMMETTAPVVPTTTTTATRTVVPPEPPSSDSNVVKIQFRFPHPQPPRTIRRFHNTQTIEDVYNYVASVMTTTTTTTTSNHHHHFECMVGFPPKNMLRLYPNANTTTIQETNLANATVQVRFIS